ncbi:MAG: DUF1573 domain-containing protein [Mariniblastus sp.]|nr:DUF1573 domain-containing protein [Mariniblastus sp.]MDG2183635.1 DUF1573 domain-containing protein [Mariniblastus sp.]
MITFKSLSAGLVGCFCVFSGTVLPAQNLAETPGQLPQIVDFDSPKIATSGQISDQFVSIRLASNTLQQGRRYRRSSQPATPRASFQGLASERSHDFGTVARGSRQEKVFEFVNTTGSNLMLTGVKTSCGCTKPKILTPEVKPGATGKLSAVFDTVNFYGNRGATLTVSVKKGAPAAQNGEIQFSVKGSIRRDVVLTPGEFSFDNVMVSQEADRIAKVLYAGNAKWKILEVKSTNPNLIAEAREVSRDQSRGRVTYELVVKLSGEQDAGTFNEFLTIVTNDANTNGMPIAVKGIVKSRIEVSPIQLGTINQGQTVKKKLILKSSKPFSIKEIKSGDSRIQFEAAEGEKNLHVLTYTLDTSKLGQIDEDLTIVTSDPDQPEAKVGFSAQIIEATTVGRSK